MESWCFDFKPKVGFMDWEFKSPFENNIVFMTQNAMPVENQGFGENLLSSPVMAATHVSFSEEHESSSELSSSVMPIENQKRIAGLNSSSPFCKVHGCNKSLVYCKDYHKRHKVCELHSKSDKVIVNGIEQRFCQQCSRFHLLSEFDDGKRSCRKRLADHNERRRKPYSGRHGRLLPPYSGKFKGSTRAKAKLHFRADDFQSMSSVTDGDDTGFIQDFMTMDSMSALSLLSSDQSEGSSSCHSSRNPNSWSPPLIMALSQNADRASEVLNNMNSDGVWSGDLSTIDLLQLSSQLERVELQKEMLFRNKRKNGGAYVGLSKGGV